MVSARTLLARLMTFSSENFPVIRPIRGVPTIITPNKIVLKTIITSRVIGVINGTKLFIKTRGIVPVTYPKAVAKATRKISALYVQKDVKWEKGDSFKV